MIRFRHLCFLASLLMALGCGPKDPPEPQTPPEPSASQETPKPAAPATVTGKWKADDGVMFFTLGADGDAEVRITDGKKAAIMTGTYKYVPPELTLDLTKIDFESNTPQEQEQYKQLFKEKRWEYDVAPEGKDLLLTAKSGGKVRLSPID